MAQRSGPGRSRASSSCRSASRRMTARTSPSPSRSECGSRLVEHISRSEMATARQVLIQNSTLSSPRPPTASRLAHKIEDRNGEQKIVNSQETRGHHRVPHELALSGDKEAIVDHLNLEKTFDRRRIARILKRSS